MLAPPSTPPPPEHARLVLVRHGQSEWNRANLFTGWVDVDLTADGIDEARQAGKLMRENQLHFDAVYTSVLRRAVRTSCLLLSALGQCYVPVVKDVRLNEQHPGALSGRNKRKLAEQHGAEQVMRWRRSYDFAPPELEPTSPLQRSIVNDARYTALRDDGAVPASESLRNCCERVDSLWSEQIEPRLRGGGTVLVVSHGNTLRGLVKRLDGISDADISQVDMPTAAPLVYTLDRATLRVVGEPHGEWGDVVAQEGGGAAAARRPARRGRFLLPDERIRQAQLAMRQQVLRDISVTSLQKAPIGDAYTAPGADSRLVEFDGDTYNVRQRPPAYFASLKPEAIERRARKEYRQWRSSRIESGDSVVSGHKKRVRAALVLVRHGKSEQNADERFSGWSDSELTARGREQSRLAGRLMRAMNVQVLHKVYTSVLTRAVKTAWLMLDEMELQWTPLRSTWRLNERHYGALQGRHKRECVQEYGLSQVQRWRRGLHDRPPEWSASAATETIDARYGQWAADPAEAPASESLADCLARLRPFLGGELWPELRRAVEEDEANGGAEDGGAVPTVCIVSSENLIRALVMEMEGLCAEEVALFNVPHATPLVFQLDASLAPMPTPWAQGPLRCGWFMGDPARVQASIERISLDLQTGSGAVASGDGARSGGGGGGSGGSRGRGSVFPTRGARGAGHRRPPIDSSLVTHGGVDSTDSCFAEGDGDDVKWVCG